MLSARFGLRRKNRSCQRRRACFRPGFEALEDRWLPSTISVNTTADVLNINPTDTIDKVNANPPQGGISLRDAIVAANNSAPGTGIGFGPLGVGPHTITLASKLPDITADGVTIMSVPGGIQPQEIRLDGSFAGNTEGFVLRGQNDTVDGLTILNFESAGVLVEGANDTVTNCSIGIDGNQLSGPNGNGIYVYSDFAVNLNNNDIENNTFDGVFVFNSVDVTIDSNLLENNANNGIRVIGQMTNPDQPFVTKITNNQIDLNAGNGIYIDDSSRNLIGEAGALQGGTANHIGSDKFGVPNEPNGGDGVLIESDGISHSTDNAITENYIGNNNGNGVELTGPGTSNNGLVNNWIGYGDVTHIDNSSAQLVVLPNKLDGVAISGGAHDNIVGGPGLFLNGKAMNGAGNLIGPNLGNGVRLSDPGTTGNAVLGNLIGTASDGKSSKDPASGNSTANGLAGVAITNGASNNLIGGPGRVSVHVGEGNLISGNTQSGVDITGAGTTLNMVEGNFVGTTLSGEVALGNGGTGVTIEQGASANTVDLKNLISGNMGDGVAILGPGTSGNLVQQNQIGTDFGETLPLGNNLAGVEIESGASGNTIGGGVSGDGNLISANHTNGVEVTGDGTTNNQVLGNFVGTNLTGQNAVGNHGDGIVVIAINNTVAGNLVSGNNLNGVTLGGSQNLVQGNRIGTNAAGTAAVPNTGNGMEIFILLGSGANTIGGTVAGSGNLISGNGKNGIHASGPGTALGNLIRGNVIGTDASGQVALANQQNGVLVDDSPNYWIGGPLATAGNLISGNKLDGVQITGNLSSGTVVWNNRIGTNLSGTVAVPNQGNGVNILNAAHNNILVSDLISGNWGDGVQISHGASQNVVRGSRIGTDAGGTMAVSNLENGVNIFERSGGNTVGGLGATGGNLISGNIGTGVRMAKLAHGNTVLGNLIGTDVSGTVQLGNHVDGVDILPGCNDNKIGLVSAGGVVAGNVISGNLGNGVLIWGAQRNIVQGNRIGTTKSGFAALGNGAAGVQLLKGASYNQIGGPGPLSAGAANVISGNGFDGVRIWGTGTTFNVLTGNLIGTDSLGHGPLGNGGNGVFVFLGAQDNIIGGIQPGTGNVIAFNAGAGVAVGLNPSDVATVHNPILSNSIFANVGLGIDLASDGVTPNTPGGPHVGPNEFQNSPVIGVVTVVGSNTYVQVSMHSIANTVFFIQVFANPAPDPSGHGQGQTLIATVPMMTNGNGDATIVVTVPQNLGGQFVAATATALGAYLETSEFSMDYLVP
jgi:parallel beta-helix repeat protein